MSAALVLLADPLTEQDDYKFISDVSSSDLPPVQRRDAMSDLMELYNQYKSLTLATCSCLAEYVDHIESLRRNLMNTDPLACTGEPIFCQKFLRGLGPEYDNFQCIFIQLHSFVGPDAVGFNVLAQKALAEEARLASQPAITEWVPRCTHCKRPFHSTEGCWFLHPHLMPSSALRKAKPKKKRVGEGSRSLFEGVKRC